MRSDKLVAQIAHAGVHDETLDVQMCASEDCHGWGVIAASGFEADETVLGR